MADQQWLSEDFLLSTPTARELYHGVARDLPILDYHNHLDPWKVASHHRFSNLTELWLDGDHYKWRAMRAMGLDESLISGHAAPKEKFLAWANTVPYTLRNPLFDWTHLELKRYFGLDVLLNGSNASYVYEHCRERMQQEAYTPLALLQKTKVELICTTDHPLDSLAPHQQFTSAELKMLPSFRPDVFLALPSALEFQKNIQRMKNEFREIQSAEALLEFLIERIDYFHVRGCRIADHGLAQLPASNSSITHSMVEKTFQMLCKGETPDDHGLDAFRYYLLGGLCREYARKGWVQQFHLGAIRNNNTLAWNIRGADQGYDSIGDWNQAERMSAFFDSLEKEDVLARTIVYNLFPAQGEVMAAMVANFNKGPLQGKMQYGAAWWFLDQKNGIKNHLDVVSNFGLLSQWVGMLTDSRSFMSFPRHEYFRRILCQVLGEEVEKGELPKDATLLEKLVQDVCYGNAKKYFPFD
ncbi:MAG: glucuronate isomerase [Cytophagaceae bacterium]|nr:glucuronate isomerase [Cytophagaceae bacterium]